MARFGALTLSVLTCLLSRPNLSFVLGVGGPLCEYGQVAGIAVGSPLCHGDGLLGCQNVDGRCLASSRRFVFRLGESAKAVMALGKEARWMGYVIDPMQV